MSERPTGTSMDESRLVALREDPASDEDSESSDLIVDVTRLLDRLGLAPGDTVDWALDDSDEPMLVLGFVPADDVGDAAYPRELRERDDSVVVPVPDRLVGVDPPDGLGLDLHAYDDENPLLFDAVATGETIGLVPVRFGDGTPYRPGRLPGVGERSDPIAEAEVERRGGESTPQPGTVDAPIDPDLLVRVANEAGVGLGTLADVLERIERHDLVSEADTAPNNPPLSVGDRVVCVVAGETWEAVLGPVLDVDLAVLEAAREVHALQAERLIERSGAAAYRTVDEEYELVVTWERDTAEWDVSDPERRER